MKKKIKLQAQWVPKKHNWTFGIGCTYILWNTRGSRYTETHCFALYILWISLQWYWETVPKLEDIDKN